MSLELYGRVVLIEDLPGEGLRAGDVGVVVEHYEARGEIPEGYELEFFSARGETVAVVSVPATAVRAADSHEPSDRTQVPGELSLSRARASSARPSSSRAHGNPRPT